MEAYPAATSKSPDKLGDLNKQLNEEELAAVGSVSKSPMQKKVTVVGSKDNVAG